MMSTNQNSCSVVCDFDGTITTRDLGGAMARHFANETSKALHQQFSNGALSLYQLQSQTWPQLRLQQDEIDQFMDAQVVMRAGLSEFIHFCQTQQIDFHIISGGFDFYIPRLLQRHGIKLPTTSQIKTNHGKPSADGMVVQFPHRHPSCDYCSNCKGHFIRQLRQQNPQQHIIGIGDGHSDHCMVAEADQVFACGYLVRYCQSEQIPHHAFNTFSDILAQLKQR